MSLEHGGILRGHRGWVTALACPSTECEVKLVSASRDKTIVAWKESPVAHILPRIAAAEGEAAAAGAAAVDGTANANELYVPIKRLEGHSDFVTDIALSNAGDYVLSGSWDKSARLWNVKTGECAKKFLGHEKDICSVAFSPDNTQIVTVGRDNVMRIWDVKAVCLGKVEKDMHSDWINCVRFSPTIQQTSSLVTGSSDNTVKVWDNEYMCKFTLRGHTAAVNTVTVSPDGSLCASAGKDGKAKLWDLVRGEHLYELDCKEAVSQICFSPNRYWLCAATESHIQVFDLETKELLASLTPEAKDVKSKPMCTSLCWSVDGSILFSGYTDGTIHWWNVIAANQ